MLFTNYRKTLKVDAKSIYFENSATLSFATLLFIALTIGFTILGSVYGSIFLNIASEKTVFLVNLTFELVGIILGFPLLFGYISFCTRFAYKEDAKLSDIFEYYSGRKKFFSACICFIKLIKAIIFKILLPLIAFIFLYNELLEFCSSTAALLPDYVLYSIKGLFLLPFILLFILCYYSFGNDISAVICIMDNCDNQKSSTFDKKRFLYLRLSLIPLYIISFLTFGILFIVFTIPYTVILYSLFFKQYRSKRNSVTLSEFDNNTDESSSFNNKTTVFDANTDITVQDNPNN